MIQNHVIDTERLKDENASDLEKKVYGDFKQKKEAVIGQLSAAFDASGASYQALGPQMQDTWIFWSARPVKISSC